MAILIRNGQMYDGDTPIRPEAGNPEHIAALKKANKAYEEAQHGVRIAIDAGIHYDITFKCVCGEFVKASGDICSAEYDYIEEAVAHNCAAEDIVATCRQCGEVYRLKADKDGNLKAFLKPKKRLCGE